MTIVTFGYKDIKHTSQNILYLYISSIILGGFIYFLNVQFSYKQVGLVFFNKGISINYIFLVIISPIILYIYVRQGIRLKNNYANYYKLILYVEKKEPVTLTAFLDTGNQLKDPYSNKPVILISNNVIADNHRKCIMLPYNGVNGSGLIKAFYANVIVDNSTKKQSVLVGVLNDKIKIDGVNCIIQNKLLEGINV